MLHGLDLRSGRIDLDAACQAIAGLKADVVAVQEVDRGLERTDGVDQIARLAELLGWHGAFGPALLGDPDTRWSACPADDPGGQPAYGVGLLSRLPLTGVRRIALPGGGDGERKPGAVPGDPGWDYEPRVALSAFVAVDGQLVRITTTHLSYLPWRCVAQLEAAARIAEAGRGRGPAALLGDLNLPAWGARLVLSGTRWVHAGGTPTYPAWEPRIQTDQILVTGGIVVRELKVGRPATSDHLPLLATLALT
ncbi:MAG: endonuclease/exonuclease/phosphatase family protein [Egibacteraceae bacterium]